MKTKKEKQLKFGNILGQCYKDFRLAKGFSQKEAASDDISVSQLSNFENGRTMLTSDVFIATLQNINVTFLEFQNLYNKRLEPNDILLFNTEVSEAYMNRNISKLENLLSIITDKITQVPNKKKFKLDKIKIQSLIASLDSDFQVPKSDINFVKHYLYALKEWGQYDIWLFGHCFLLFDFITTADLAQKMVDPTSINNDLHYTKHAMFQTLNNIISVSINDKMFSLAEKYINYLENSNIHEYYLYDKLTLRYNKAMLAYKRGNKASIETLKECKRMFEFCDCYYTANLIAQEIKNL